LDVLRSEDVMALFGVDSGSVDCAGLKLTLAEVFRIFSPGRLGVGVRELPRYEEVIAKDGWFYLEPGPYLIKYGEYVRIPNGYVGLAIQRSSLLRMGASLYTAVWDPGYEGRGSGLLVVHNPKGIWLEKGVQIAQLVMIKMTGKTSMLYRGTYYKER